MLIVVGRGLVAGVHSFCSNYRGMMVVKGVCGLAFRCEKVPWVRHVAADPDGEQQYPGWPRGGQREGAQRRAWGTRRAVSGQRGDNDGCVVGDEECGARVLKASRSLVPPPRQGSAAAVSPLLPLCTRDAPQKPGSSHCAASTSPRLRWSPSSLLHMRGLSSFTSSYCHLIRPQSSDNVMTRHHTRVDATTVCLRPPRHLQALNSLRQPTRQQIMIRQPH